VVLIHDIHDCVVSLRVWVWNWDESGFQRVVVNFGEVAAPLITNLYKNAIFIGTHAARALLLGPALLISDTALAYILPSSGEATST
jgi:hypothetical protein